MAVAPLLCSCGRPLRLRWEVPDWDGVTPSRRVFVGKLDCPRGHSWIDIRDAKESRPHPGAVEAQPSLPFDV